MEPSLSTVKRLFALSRNRCAFPQCASPIVEDSGTVTGVICHVKARSLGGQRYDPEQTDEERHAFQNLILMCARHSKLIDSEPRRFTSDLLTEMKKLHEQQSGSIELSQSDARKAELLLKDYRSLYIAAGGHVMLNSPGGLQASTLIFKTEKKTVRLNPVDGTIGADRCKRNYTKHLIDRYNEFASQQPNRRFSYAAIYNDIKKKFGAKWDGLSVELFDDLAVHLQRKIDRTMIGSMNRGKGQKNYSLFTEYLEKYESGKKK